MNTAAAEAFGAGYLAAQATIAILEQTMSVEDIQNIARSAVIPAYASSNYGDHDHGASEAWSDWQAAKRLEARRQNWRR